ncbi:MAG: aminomethyl-transferring glycine dehydrogenase subunit GcvPA [Candidatus Lokiarchaeota archaeon]|nr:aminomethyl-transferring glycine dehydrogenase subunit GcvPA [Candidatus Lokiarchaeota archaeon]
MDFSPLSKQDILEMLKTIGVDSIEDLFRDIPKSIRNPLLGIGNGNSELETRLILEDLASKNTVYTSYFRGAGMYNHYIPPVVNQIINRNEFYTAYTPYQPEVSQGYLQAIFEYQTAICNLTGMYATNASVYDGANALVEAAIMSKNITRRNSFLIIGELNPEYYRVFKTYGFSCEFQILSTNLENYKEMLQLGEYAAVVIQNPTFFGNLQDLENICKTVKEISPKTLIIEVIIESTSLGLLKKPASFGVDIVCGEGQPLGIPMSFGGPSLGFLATTKQHYRKLSGRIVGETTEIDGKKKGYLLTLQAREQHIRREKALSNICSNQALCGLAIIVYLTAMGYKGLRKVAELNVKNAYYLKSQLKDLPGIEVLNGNTPTFNEFLISVPTGFNEHLEKICIQNHLLPPYLLEKDTLEITREMSMYDFKNERDYLLTCVTEMNRAEHIQEFIQIFKQAMQLNGGSPK